jgi:hypothetical protein
MSFVRVLKHKVRGYRPDIVQHKSMKMPSSVSNNYQNCNEKGRYQVYMPTFESKWAYMVNEHVRLTSEG